ncbi:hypothetical protein E2562_025280 [Oryza meyeriana var. granulata]|uniref:DUF834 domain-containing protein n=1 Tax=Oryza meyeriana var. granulata TaxID=110450 RepID=A0A6G1BNT7_9ORYZ|nr:hypothetical protein E2562_025280 [Oryza meyeriana var. granulata]
MTMAGDGVGSATRAAAEEDDLAEDGAWRRGRRGEAPLGQHGWGGEGAATRMLTGDARQMGMTTTTATSGVGRRRAEAGALVRDGEVHNYPFVTDMWGPGRVKEED